MGFCTFIVCMCVCTYRCWFRDGAGLENFQGRQSRLWFLSYGFPPQKKSKKSSETLTFKRPEGMHREVYALLYSDKKQVLESQAPQALSLIHLHGP